MTRRRLAAVALAAAFVGGVGAAQVAVAAPARSEGPVDVTALRGKYWACVAVDGVDLGACIENPLPDPNALADLLGLRAAGR